MIKAKRHSFRMDVDPLTDIAESTYLLCAIRFNIKSKTKLCNTMILTFCTENVVQTAKERTEKPLKTIQHSRLKSKQKRRLHFWEQLCLCVCVCVCTVYKYILLEFFCPRCYQPKTVSIKAHFQPSNIYSLETYTSSLFSHKVP